MKLKVTRDKLEQLWGDPGNWTAGLFFSYSNFRILGSLEGLLKDAFARAAPGALARSPDAATGPSAARDAMVRLSSVACRLK